MKILTFKWRYLYTSTIQEMCCGSSEKDGEMASFCGKHITFSEDIDIRAD